MKRVLFLCVHNSARSQMAEGLLRAIAGERFQVFSAGSEPTYVQPLAIRALRELGIDVTAHGQHSKSVNEFIDQPFDYVITLCAEQVCPTFPGAARRLHWNLPDPAAAAGSDAEKLNAFRQVRDELRKRLDELIQDDQSPSGRGRPNAA
jgi:arsenate reductase